VSKIYDALEHASRTKDSGSLSSQVDVPSVSLPVPPSNEHYLDMEQEMISLYQVITAALPDINHRSVLLIGSRSNEGTSTIARQLAKSVSLRMEKSVLLIDLDRSRPDLHVYTNTKKSNGEDNKVDAGDSPEKALCQVEDSSLYVMPLFQQTMVSPRTLETFKTGAFWEPLKDRFDLLIVDSPPASLFPDGMGLVSQVDGVILVVEAEKTRWQVALSVKEKILQHGGNLLGTVLNKRKFYIPDFIYRHL
jgi:Mrp family chromosome partitioning ATPase